MFLKFEGLEFHTHRHTHARWLHGIVRGAQVVVMGAHVIDMGDHENDKGTHLIVIIAWVGAHGKGTHVIDLNMLPLKKDCHILELTGNQLHLF